MRRLGSAVRRNKLRRICEPPTRKGLEVLFDLRRGVGPHKRLARQVEAALPAQRLVDRAVKRPELETTRVSRAPSSEDPPSYVAKWAALAERIRMT